MLLFFFLYLQITLMIYSYYRVVVYYLILNYYKGDKMEKTEKGIHLRLLDPLMFRLMLAYAGLYLALTIITAVYTNNIHSEYVAYVAKIGKMFAYPCTAWIILAMVELAWSLLKTSIIGVTSNDPEKMEVEYRKLLFTALNFIGVLIITGLIIINIKEWTNPNDLLYVKNLITIALTNFFYVLLYTLIMIILY